MTDRSDNPSAGGPDGLGPNDAYAVEVLDAASCWSLLRANAVGRIAACVDDHPYIVPVTFVVDRESVVFRTAAGTKLSVLRDHDVAFEVDRFDASTGTAASVILTGRASEVVDADEWEQVSELPLFPWLVGPKSHFVRIMPTTISGRRFRSPYAG